MDSKDIRYEESILTALLKDTLGGKSKTGLICCISPSKVDHVATADTLRFAAMAALVESKVGALDQDQVDQI